MGTIRAIFFDVDGVLLDSLRAHLTFCQAKNEEYFLGLTLPSEQQVREIAARGVSLSPMSTFLEVLGFQNDVLKSICLEYQRDFHTQYAIDLFPYVGAMLQDLKANGYILGIVTSNVLKNVQSALGDVFSCFHPGAIFAKKENGSIVKSAALLQGLENLKLTPQRALYVGDQVSDWKASLEAGTLFVGVSQGWGITKNEHRFPVISSSSNVLQYVKRQEGV